MTTIKATLYYADWCGHCKNFKPEWKSFTEDIDNGKIKHDTVAFQYEALEDKEISNKGISATINGEDIKGYPTLKISVTKNGKISNEFEYQGKRDSKELATFMSIVADRENK